MKSFGGLITDRFDEAAIRALGGTIALDLPDKTTPSGEEVLIEKIRETVRRSDMDDIDKEIAIYKFFIDIKQGEMTEGQKELSAYSSDVIELSLEKLKDDKINLNSDEDMQGFVNDLKDTLSNYAMHIFKEVRPGSRSMGNALFFMNYIDREMVLRITPEGRVLLPSRLDPPYGLSQADIERNGLNNVRDFVLKAKDRARLTDVFDNLLFGRFYRIGWSVEKIDAHRDQLIDTLLNRADVDVVRARGSLARRKIAFHARRGASAGRNPGVWIGELTLRQLMTEPDGLEFMAHIFLEEAQHFGDAFKKHGLFERDEEGNDNVASTVEHGKGFWLRVRKMIKDIDRQIFLASEG